MMRVYFEAIGMLGPVYRMVGRGLTDHDIASTLNVEEAKVKSCIAWTLHFLRFTQREQLVAEARGPLLVLMGTPTSTEASADSNGDNSQR